MIKKRKKKTNSIIKEWGKALALALIFALVIRNFVIQSFVVSSTKMEKTLLLGDYIIVNKTKYGARFPITPLTFPFSNKLYAKIIQLPYFRLPNFGNIEHNDLIVFNYPSLNIDPIDKRQTIIKRCIALPGDTLLIENKNVFINSIVQPHPNKVQFSFRIVTNGEEIKKEFLDKYNITEGGKVSDIGVYDFPLDKKRANLIQQNKDIRYINELSNFKDIYSSLTFPNSKLFSWNNDYFGPVTIPFKGQTIELKQQTYLLYKNIIETHEHNKVEFKDSVFYINGTISSRYIIKNNYYFVMDDNRDNAKDSRTWGFLPESHIIGHTNFIWFSINKQQNKIRWHRLFKKIQ